MEIGEKLYADLLIDFKVDFDESGTIGKRYRRQDEVGTPFCITIDYETLSQGGVTVRQRDSMAQERISLEQVSSYLSNAIRNS